MIWRAPDLLSRYAVLYLPDICHLNEAQLDGVRQFVAAGGGLVMTYATSLYADDGSRRPDFALGELARIRHVEPDTETRRKMESTLAMGGVWDLYLKARPAQSVLRGPRADELLPTAIYEPVEVLPGGTVVADMVMGSGREALFPGLIVAPFGKGKVAYLPAALDAMYRQTRMREFAEILGDVIRSVSPRERPYEIDAPSGLIANMMSRGNSRVLHLVNWTGCNFETEQQEVYYLPPIDNVVIRVRIPDGKRVGRIQLFVPTEFSQRTIGGQLQVTLPRVENYQGLVVEFE